MGTLSIMNAVMYSSNLVSANNMNSFESESGCFGFMAIIAIATSLCWYVSRCYNDEIADM
ncbi:MAG: hypothetical protein KBT33_00680 [Prevotellaceae bacterium]|nr:hypothetical protein [Candidatus Minthosoma equi]